MADNVLTLETHKFTDAAAKALQCRLGCKRLTYSACALELKKSCNCECHKVWATFDELCAATAILPEPAKPTVQEREERNIRITEGLDQCIASLQRMNAILKATAPTCPRCGHSECWRAKADANAVDHSDPHSWYRDGTGDPVLSIGGWTWKCHTCTAEIIGGKKPCD